MVGNYYYIAKIMADARACGVGLASCMGKLATSLATLANTDLSGLTSAAAKVASGAAQANTALQNVAGVTTAVNSLGTIFSLFK